MMHNHYAAQIGRFARLFVAAFAATGILTSSSYGKDAIVAAVIGALETAYREISPTSPPGV